MTISQTISLIRGAFADQAFAVPEAQACGIGPDRLERAVRAGALLRLRRGVYSLPDFGGSLPWGIASTRARQLADRGVSAVISGATSAEFWDVPIIGARHNSLALNPTLYVDPATGVRDGLRDGVRVVHALLGSEDVWEGEVHAPRGFAGNRYRVCMPLRTAVDITRHLRLSEPAVVAVLVAAQRRHAALLDGWVPALAPHSHSGERARAPSDGRAHSRLTEGLKDAALREALRQELLDVVLRSPRRGLRQVVAALPIVDPLLETALESISWSHMWRSGLPLPLLQQWVTGASGKRYRVDFLWPEFRLIGEADGAVKYRSADDVMAEKERHGDLGDAGHGLVRWTWRDAWETQAFLARIERAMGRAGHR